MSRRVQIAGELKQPELMLNPDICTFDDLDAKEKEYDAITVKEIAKRLPELGYGLTRSKPAPADVSA